LIGRQPAYNVEYLETAKAYNYERWLISVGIPTLTNAVARTGFLLWQADSWNLEVIANQSY
jgi:hypothetical protein